MTDAADRFAKALDALNAVADELTPEDARRVFDEATLQVFWREWPHVSSWAGTLWRRLNEEVSDDVVEIGGEGG